MTRTKAARTPRSRSAGAASSAATHYVDKARLAALIAAAQSTGRASDELGQVLIKMAGGVWDKHRPTESRDDFVGDTCAHLLGSPLRRADPAQNCFGYLTTCIYRFAWKLRAKRFADATKAAAFRADYLAAVELDRRRSGGPGDSDELDDGLFDLEPDPVLVG